MKNEDKSILSTCMKAVFCITLFCTVCAFSYRWKVDKDPTAGSNFHTVKPHHDRRYVGSDDTGWREVDNDNYDDEGVNEDEN